MSRKNFLYFYNITLEDFITLSALWPLPPLHLQKIDYPELKAMGFAMELDKKQFLRRAHAWVYKRRRGCQSEINV